MVKKTPCSLSLEIGRTLQKLQHSAQDPSELFRQICAIESCRKYADKSQQDCCELLMRVMVQWSETSRSVFTLFEGGTKYTVGCFECPDRRDTYEPFTILELTLENQSTSIDGIPGIETLLLGRLASDELLHEENKVRCPKCNRRTT